MRKELLWVIGIGIVLGLIFAFGIYRINSSLPKKTGQTEATPKPKSQEFKITLSKPEDGDVVTQDTISVSGITKSKALIVISGEKGDYLLQADERGVFSEDVGLTSGVNQIKLTAFDPNGAQSVQKVLVVYSSSFQEKSVPTPAGISTSASDIRMKVEEKVAAALNRPKAYMGTVTDITDSTIQIKSDESQIKQISATAQEITVVKTTGNTNKAVKLSDIAIGDYIVAMGYINSNSVLSAQRILITEVVTEPKIYAHLASVTAVTKKNITVSQIGGDASDTLTPDKSTDVNSFTEGKILGLKFSSISEGDIVLYILDASGTPPILRSVFLTQTPQAE